MGTEKEALPKVEIATASEGAHDASPGAQIVPGTVTKVVGARPWKWTEKKRAALKHVLDGKGVVEIGKLLDVHRNTVRNWLSDSTFQDAIRRRVSERQTNTKLKRLRATEILTDTLATRAAESIRDPQAIDPNKARLFLQEHRAYVREERDLYGEGQSGGAQGGPGTMVNIVMGGQNGPSPVDGERRSTAMLAFSDFMAAYDPAMTVIAATPQEAAARIAEKVLQESNLIDTIREEDRAILNQEAAAEAEAKRRR